MNDLISRLKSEDISERVEATYEVTRRIIDGNPQVVSILRGNLNSQSDDLVEISIMRLGIRAKDLGSLDKIIDISVKSSSPLVLSASIFAMSSIAEAYPEKKENVKARLMTMEASHLDDQLLKTIQAELFRLDGGR